MAVILRNNNLFCDCCGNKHILTLPLTPKDFGKLVKRFKILHNSCPQTWIEPQPNKDDMGKEKAMWWLANGEVGLSSKTIWNCMMGNVNYPIDIPYDPDDFKRCYKLLQIVPEWKNNLIKLKPLSPAWNNLVNNWDKLTEMFEENERTNWKNYKKIGMFEFMQSLRGKSDGN